MTITTPERVESMSLREIENLEVPAGTGLLQVMDKTAGDIRVRWDHTNADEVAIAKGVFNDAKAKRMLAFSVAGDKSRTAVTDFPATAERLVMTPQVVGG